MRWTKHIDTITAKANSKLGFIKRNININNRTVKDQAYKSLVSRVVLVNMAKFKTAIILHLTP